MGAVSNTTVGPATIRNNELVFVIVLLYCYIVMYLVFVYLCIYHVLHLPYSLFVQVTVCVNSCLVFVFGHVFVCAALQCEL